LPDGVARAGVGVDHRLQRVRPPSRRSRVRGEDRHCVRGGGGVEGPTEQLRGRPVIEGGGMEERLERGPRLALPEPASLDPAGRETGAGGKAGRADHRRQRVLTPADG
jgi:hypothetical protein